MSSRLRLRDGGGASFGHITHLLQNSEMQTWWLSVTNPLTPNQALFLRTQTPPPPCPSLSKSVLWGQTSLLSRTLREVKEELKSSPVRIQAGGLRQHPSACFPAHLLTADSLQQWLAGRLLQDALRQASRFHHPPWVGTTQYRVSF